MSGAGSLFGSAFRDARQQAGLSLTDVARLLGFTVPYVSDVERGQRAPFAPGSVLLAARAFGVPSVPLLCLAVRSRGYFTLPAGSTERHLDVAVALSQHWPTLTQDQLAALQEILGPVDAE